MRNLFVAILGAVGVVAILAAGGAAPAKAVADPVLGKCIDCEGQSCHSVVVPAYRSCLATPDGCADWDECG
jgi:hypothetical protein